MKFTVTTPLVLSLATHVVSSAMVATSAWALEGYAKDNPLGATTGGSAGASVTVSSFVALQAAVADDEPRTVYVQGNFNQTSLLKIGSNKTLIGTCSDQGSWAVFKNITISVKNASNVIIRNFAITSLRGQDAITIQNSTRVWIDHNEFSSDMDHGPDEYDGQIDITHGSDWITVSWNYLHDHWKSSLVGSSVDHAAVDRGRLHVTYHHNHWRNIGTRTPAGRFGHQHVYNNYLQDLRYQGIHSRSDNQVLVEANVFTQATHATNAGPTPPLPEALSTYGLVIPADSPNTCVCGDEEADGFANLGAENDFGGAGVNITRVGNFSHVSYPYRFHPLGQVAAVVQAGAGVGRGLPVRT